MMSRWWLTVLLLPIHGYHAQQTYIENRQLDCNNNYTTAFDYTCNGPSYLTFRSQPPLYNTLSSIAALLNSNPNDITTLNNFSSDSATIPVIFLDGAVVRVDATGLQFAWWWRVVQLELSRIGTRWLVSGVAYSPTCGWGCGDFGEMKM
ncbi:hypothetical protein L1987_08691 [Smallanthus sonchifolius]|uniref:Uncharacterized protein n=1 Tax=Smallanthus sonchifolius TaxID=185202 RepID=A0ACB9JLW1_9ASTR|nr:hypothetical protein L1987_08691 [Smallanthus sonchifolius]